MIQHSYPNANDTPLFVDVFDGHVLQTDLARRALGLQRRVQGTRGVDNNLGTNVDSRHFLLQRHGLLSAHNHDAQQTAQNQTQWNHSLFHEVFIAITVPSISNAF
jgi:phage gp46-like protein